MECNILGTNKQTPQLKFKGKARVLCLHGYGQNANSFKTDIKELIIHVNKYAEFVFINAPHKSKLIDDSTEPQEDQLSWWFNNDDSSFAPGMGFQDSLKLVEDTWKTQGPFQGLLGFSQGACFVGVICGLAKRKLTIIRPEFAIICSGFISDSFVHESAYDESITIPTLHVYGLADEIISKEMSQHLANHFTNAQVLEHNGGHYFPNTSRQKQTYVDFFKNRFESDETLKAISEAVISVEST